MPVNTNQMFPVPAEEGVAVPALNFTQFLSEYAGVVFGKLDTTSGDMNEFAHGKGDTQFMNMAFNLNPALLMTVPYSTLGAGLIILPTKDPHAAIVTFSVVSAKGEADTSGFDTLNSDTLSFNLEARVRTDFFGLTGHQLVGAIYSNKDYTSMDQRLSLERGSNSIAKETDSWSVYYNFDQYFYEPVKGSGRGVGIFGRFAATDGNPNLINYFYSLGIGGKGIMASRPHDRFGLGWYYIDIKNPTFTGPLMTRVFLQDEQGVEAYYSVALTPWAHLTPNIQVIRGAQKQTVAPLPANRTDIDTATILGLRLQLLL
jgi:porin